MSFGSTFFGTFAPTFFGSSSIPAPVSPSTNTTPIPELIALVLVSRLEAITEEAGYLFTVPFVRRVSRDGRDWTPKANAIAVVQGDAERNPDQDCPGSPPANAYNLTFEVKGFVSKPEHQEYPDAADANEMEAVMLKAITEGQSDWHQFDGNSRVAHFGTTTYERSSTHLIVTVPIVVTYRISELDPYLARN
jgi:hypothetical protein